MNLFENEHEVTRFEKVTYINLALLIVLILMGAYQTSSQALTNYQLKKDETLVAGESIKDFCFYTFKNIIEEKFSSLSLDPVIYKTLVNDPDIFDFKEGEFVLNVVTGKDQCRIISKSDEGIRGFLVTLTSSIKNPHFYRIDNISEEEDPNLDKEKL